MRKVTKGMIDSLIDRKPYRSANTTVELDTRQDGKRLATVYLHGNHIATIGYGKDLRPATMAFSDAGWATRTTCDRLHAIVCKFLPGARFNLSRGIITLTEPDGRQSAIQSFPGRPGWVCAISPLSRI